MPCGYVYYRMGMVWPVTITSGFSYRADSSTHLQFWSNDTWVVSLSHRYKCLCPVYWQNCLGNEYYHCIKCKVTEWRGRAQKSKLCGAAEPSFSFGNAEYRHCFMKRMHLPKKGSFSGTKSHTEKKVWNLDIFQLKMILKGHWCTFSYLKWHTWIVHSKYRHALFSYKKKKSHSLYIP